MRATLALVLFVLAAVLALGVGLMLTAVPSLLAAGGPHVELLAAWVVASALVGLVTAAGLGWEACRLL